MLTFNEVGYDEKLYNNQELLVECIIHQINKANARKEGMRI